MKERQKPQGKNINELDKRWITTTRPS